MKGAHRMNAATKFGLLHVPNTGDNEWGEVGTARLHALNPTTATGEIDRLNCS
jgi:hypothetical protein